MSIELDESEYEEEGEILRRIVAFLLSYFESRDLVIDEAEEPKWECEKVDAVPL